MTDAGIFLIRSSLSMSLLYLVYWLFLRRETLFRANRFYLLSALALSLILPLISIRYTVASPEGLLTGGSSASLPSLSIFHNSTGGYPILLRIIGIIYLCGVIIFLFRILWQFLILFSIILRNGIKNIENTRLVYNDRYQMPFSFMNMIFINPQNIRQNEINDIIAHEKVHIRENHWFDLLIVEIISIFLWFNPFIWFFERSIKQNHEYLADEGVIAQGYNVGRYHSVLINQLMGMEVIGITNNLNYSLNTKRLKMMKKQKTPKKRALHILWALPLVFLLLASFAQPRYVEADRNASDIIIGKDISLTVAVTDGNGDAIPGASIHIKGTKKGTTTDANGVFSIDVTSSDIIFVEFKGFEKAAIFMEKIIQKKGDSKSYKLKLELKPDRKKEAVKMSTSDEIKNLEILLKELTIRKEELNKMKQKIAKAEEEGTVDQKQLDEKKIKIKKEAKMITEKAAKIKKKLETLKK